MIVVFVTGFFVFLTGTFDRYHVTSDRDVEIIGGHTSHQSTNHDCFASVVHINGQFAVLHFILGIILAVPFRLIVIVMINRNLVILTKLVVVVEDVAIGGQAGRSSRIENYLGFPAGLSGADLARRAGIEGTRWVRSDVYAAREAAKKLGLPFLGEIPLDINIRVKSDGGQPVALDDSTAYGKAFHEIARAVAEQVSAAKGQEISIE